MRTNTIAIVTAAIFAGLVVSSATSAPAQSGDSQTPGIVHISDSAPIQNTTGRTVGGKTIVSPVHYEHSPHSQWASGNCGCGHSQCASGNCGCSSCGTSAWSHRRLLNGLTKHSADHGWGRPVKRPIQRVPVMYQRYWPQAWNGHQRGGKGGAHKTHYPMVYMPTDTTQLGFYYQRVPFWRPNPAMTPPVPWPGQWHQRECGARPAGHNYSQAVFPHWSSNSYPVLQHGGDLKPQPDGQPQVPPAPPKDLKQSAQNFIP